MQSEYRRKQKDANLSNTQAAEYLDLNISTIKRYRNGTLKAPKTVIMALESKVKEINNAQ